MGGVFVKIFTLITGLRASYLSCLDSACVVELTRTQDGCVVEMNVSRKYLWRKHIIFKSMNFRSLEAL